MIRVKRVYDEPSLDDGHRVLVDRLWPRGLTKEKAKVDRWAKELSPSNELRQWYGHEPSKWEEFQRRYREELVGQEVALGALADLGKRETVTLLYGSTARRENNADALKLILDEL